MASQVFRHIFTGPSSALGTPSQGTKNPKATIYGLTAVTGRTIAYAAVQVRPTLVHPVTRPLLMSL
jgi:hypothetical protein